jgi:hypothetical protein
MGIPAGIALFENLKMENFSRGNENGGENPPKNLV